MHQTWKRLRIRHDLADRYRSLYNVNRKSNKWWLRIFWGLLDITFVNAYVIYGEMFGKTDVLEVRRSIALGLITRRDSSSKKSVNLKRPVPETYTNQRGKQLSNKKDVRLGKRGIHWTVYGAKRGRCELCSPRGVESMPSSKCSHCQMFLYSNEKRNCSNEYHEVENTVV